MVRSVKALLEMKLDHHCVDAQGVSICLSAPEKKIVFEGKFSIDEGDCLHSTCEHFLKCGEGWRKVQIMKRSYVIALSLVLMRSGITCLFERDFMHALKKCEYRFEQSLKYLQRKMCTPLKLTMNELSLVKAQFRKESSEIRSLEENIATLMQKGDASACVEKISELIARREELVEINSKLALAQGKANELLCKKKQQMEKKLHPACPDSDSGIESMEAFVRRLRGQEPFWLG